MTAHLEVIDPGLFTTVQDLGRRGGQALGIPVSGVMDQASLRLANTLVGNPDGTAGLEISVLGPTFRVEAEAVRIALAGTQAGIEILSGPGGAFPALRSLRLTFGQVFRVDAFQDTAYACLAVEGGFDLPPVFGSLSTYVRGAIGGLEGRALNKGDRLPLSCGCAGMRRECQLDAERVRFADGPIRVVPGPQDDRFTEKGLRAFLDGEYTVTPQSDRMGLRLSGPVIEHAGGHDILSEGIAIGSIQVPGNGQPIILVADHQTTGGYPKIATVITADIPRLARALPGRRLRFAAVTEAEAIAARREREAALAACKSAISPVEERSRLELLLGENLISGVVKAKA
jgi:biotin-dependent carboxylase-like uncharacterized protein